MKKIRIKKKELKKMIKDLDKAHDVFNGFGDNLWDTMSEYEQNLFGNAEKLLGTTVTKLKKIVEIANVEKETTELSYSPK